MILSTLHTQHNHIDRIKHKRKMLNTNTKQYPTTTISASCGRRWQRIRPLYVVKYTCAKVLEFISENCLAFIRTNIEKKEKKNDRRVKEMGGGGSNPNYRAKHKSVYLDIVMDLHRFFLPTDLIRTLELFADH